MAARAADGPGFGQGLAGVADGDLLDVELPPVGVEGISRGQLPQCGGGAAIEFDGPVVPVGVAVPVVCGPVKPDAPFGKGVIGQQPLVRQDFQGRDTIEAVDPDQVTSADRESRSGFGSDDVIVMLL